MGGVQRRFRPWGHPTEPRGGTPVCRIGTFCGHSSVPGGLRPANGPSESGTGVAFKFSGPQGDPTNVKDHWY